MRPLSGSTSRLKARRQSDSNFTPRKRKAAHTVVSNYDTRSKLIDTMDPPPPVAQKMSVGPTAMEPEPVPNTEGRQRKKRKGQKLPPT